MIPDWPWWLWVLIVIAACGIRVRVPGVFYPPASRDGRTWEGDAFVITTHLQRAYLQNGDWVITEPDGEHHYPCQDKIFAATYEAVKP